MESQVPQLHFRRGGVPADQLVVWERLLVLLKASPQVRLHGLVDAGRVNGDLDLKRIGDLDAPARLLAEQHAEDAF
eukprot:CAMPEP_0181225810 /NCGR_PEP_ID=MMETSP1096-20121128/31908_1 /TAXON_ID=156174 ORGANISM="Chrysochromulina ericina, Strain CCMP281" /NCGR_SAMPLE_ID=MMETSP1096 /ASSEMBLY_ACC=CAM_ASM_000453 /LENGTH=75 /DNA_ID=CAMNT_0023319083 /DNA_START=981 /DNA_END=1208 /DNA_ORIENTATION=+